MKTSNNVPVPLDGKQLTRTKIVETARGWIGTPYIDQASLKHVGCDCLGMLRGIWREIYGTEPEVPPPYTRDWAESRRKGGRELMLEAARKYFDEIALDEIEPGDLLLIRVRNESLVKHCAIVSAICPIHIIHAYSSHCVSEDVLHRNWVDKDMYLFKFRGLA